MMIVYKQFFTYKTVRLNHTLNERHCSVSDNHGQINSNLQVYFVKLKIIYI